MAGWDNGVAVPGGASYLAPLLNFSPIGNLPGVYRQAGFDQQQKTLNDQQQQMNDVRIKQVQQQIDLSKAFAGGLPKDGQGNIDYRAAAGILASKGDIGGAVSLLQQAPPAPSPLLGGGGQTGGAPGAGQPGGAAPQAGGAPPASVQARPLPPPAANSPQGDQGGSVIARVTEEMPSGSDKIGTVATNIARSVGVDPNAALTPDQASAVDARLKNYLKRNNLTPQGGAAPDTRIASAFAALPPSANAGTPAPPSAASAQPQAAPARPQAAPQQPQQQGQGAPSPQQPLTPQVPLPQGFTDPQAAILALNREAAKYDAMPNGKGQAAALREYASQIQESIKPLSVGPQSSIIDPRTGKVLYEGPAAAALRATENAGSSPTLDADAQVYRTTGKLPPNMGRGIQGNAEAKMIRQRATELELAEGGNPADWPGKWQNYQVAATGKRVIEQRAANLRLVENETATLIPRVRDISGKVSRTEYPTINSLILAAKKGSGDPNVIKLGVAFESLIPVYARLLKPTGQITEGDTKRSHEILDKAWSNGQVNAALDQMEIERTGAREALDKTLEEVRGGSKSEGAKSSSTEGKGSKPDADGWISMPNGVRIREVK